MELLVDADPARTGLADHSGLPAAGVAWLRRWPLAPRGARLAGPLGGPASSFDADGRATAPAPAQLRPRYTRPASTAGRHARYTRPRCGLRRAADRCALGHRVLPAHFAPPVAGPAHRARAPLALARERRSAPRGPTPVVASAPARALLISLLLLAFDFTSFSAAAPCASGVRRSPSATFRQRPFFFF